MHRRLLARIAPVGLVLALALTACGTDAADDPNTPSGEALERTDTPPPPTEDPSETESSTEKEEASPEEVITITRKGDEISPNGARVEVALGEEITIAIKSDVAGELHVHSTPEQEISYEKGISAHKLSFEQPGVVEVESHDPDTVVLQLQVS